VTIKVWRCVECGYEQEGPETPRMCPECGASCDAFELEEYEEVREEDEGWDEEDKEV
jgi:ABC-type ATPase with predicted acetyltransferase domain